MTSNLLASQTAVLVQDYHLFFPAGGTSRLMSASPSSRREASTGPSRLWGASAHACNRKKCTTNMLENGCGTEDLTRYIEKKQIGNVENGRTRIRIRYGLTMII